MKDESQWSALILACVIFFLIMLPNWLFKPPAGMKPMRKP